jgi:N-acyl-D-amino-acid deacylase
VALKFAFLLVAVLVACPPCGAGTGVPVPELAVFDQLLPEMLARWHIRGASLAIAVEGRLVFARGYGLADVEAGAPVEPQSLFRISSVSKTLTAAGVMKLVEEGRLDLDARAFELLDHLTPPPGAAPDPRLYNITVRQLLHHTGGFDQNKGGTNANEPLRPPMSVTAANELRAPHPASAATIIRWMMGRPLDFDPGVRHVYSSFGYCVLGRVIERVTGEPYAEYIRRAVLAPAGITGTRPGRARLSERAPGEVRYYNYPSMPVYTSVYGEGQVPFAYGAYGIEATDASGGWISSAVDLVRFGVALDGQRGPGLLSPGTLRLMAVPPEPPATSDYGLGWYFAVSDEGTRLWHFGGTPYTASSYLARLPNGVWLAVLFNGTASGSYWSEMEALATSTAAAIKEWPAHDLFARYYPQDAPSFTRAGVLNAASAVSAPVAPGELVAIAGERLGPARATGGADAGTRVLFDGAPAELLSASAGRVIAVAPDGLAGQASTSIAVEYQGARSGAVAVEVAAAAPGLFPFALNRDGHINAGHRPAAPGETITLWGTGQGRASAVEAFVQDRAAAVISYAPTSVLFQIQLRVPAETAVSNAVPVTVRIAGVESPPLAVAVGYRPSSSSSSSSFSSASGAKTARGGGG